MEKGLEGRSQKEITGRPHTVYSICVPCEQICGEEGRFASLMKSVEEVREGVTEH